MLVSTMMGTVGTYIMNEAHGGVTGNKQMVHATVKVPVL
jgi:hypothetical protein